MNTQRCNLEFGKAVEVSSYTALLAFIHVTRSILILIWSH